MAWKNSPDENWDDGFYHQLGVINLLCPRHSPSLVGLLREEINIITEWDSHKVTKRRKSSGTQFSYTITWQPLE